MFKHFKISISYFRNFSNIKNERILNETGLNSLQTKKINNKTKVPLQPINNALTFTESAVVEESVEIDSKTIQLLERLSLVDLDSQEAYKILKDSVRFANQIFNINTVDIKPLYTVLEDHCLYMREDIVTDGNIKKEILRNAISVEEDYFVAPPGNIPLEQEEKKFE